MPSPLFNQLNPQPSNNIIKQFMEFKRTFNGDPRQMIQQLLKSGKVTQSQINQYSQQANQIYNQIKNMR